jgi:hypothetical protein
MSCPALERESRQKEISIAASYSEWVQMVLGFIITGAAIPRTQLLGFVRNKSL